MSLFFELHPTLKADSFVLGRFEFCLLLLINDRQYPWFVLVPQEKDITEIYQLSAEKRQLLWTESHLLSQAIMQQFAGDKLNVAAIGNMVPQLHIHHVVRFRGDPVWPKPVWGQLAMKPYSTQEVEDIKQNLAKNLLNPQFKRVD